MTYALKTLENLFTWCGHERYLMMTDYMVVARNNWINSMQCACSAATMFSPPFTFTRWWPMFLSEAMVGPHFVWPSVRLMALGAVTQINSQETEHAAQLGRIWSRTAPSTNLNWKCINKHSQRERDWARDFKMNNLGLANLAMDDVLL